MASGVKRGACLVAFGFAAGLGGVECGQAPGTAKALRLPFGLDWDTRPATIVTRLCASGATKIQDGSTIIAAEGPKPWGIASENVHIESTPEGISMISLTPKSGGLTLPEVIDKLRAEYGDPEVGRWESARGHPWLALQPPGFGHQRRRDDSFIVITFVHAARARAIADRLEIHPLSPLFDECCKGRTPSWASFSI